MCFSVLFTGCAEKNENANVDNIDKIENADNIDNVEDEQASAGISDVIGSSIGDKIEDAVSNVLRRQQPSSQRVIELAEKNELKCEDIENYADYLLYVNQDNSTLRAVRDITAPGRGKELPFDVLFNVNSLDIYDVNYLIPGHFGGTLLTYAEYTYFYERFHFTNNLNLMVYYTMPDKVESGYDFFRKTYCAINAVPEGETIRHRIVEYDESLFENNTLLSLKDSEVQTKTTFVKVCDNLLLRYNKNGDLDRVEFYVDGVYVEVNFPNPSEKGYFAFAQVINKTSSAFLTALLNKDTVLTAINIVEDIVEESRKQD